MKIVTTVRSDRADLYLPALQQQLDQLGVAYHLIDDRDHRLGMAGAVRAAWGWALEQGADYLFDLEEDFLFVEVPPLDRMVDILETNPQLSQLVLKRQPWNDTEKAAGGIIEANPADYVDRDGWVEHKRIFSLNPCLIPRHVLHMGWPDSNEAGMTDLLVGKGFTFGFYGARHDPPRVVHVGVERSQGWRL